MTKRIGFNQIVFSTASPDQLQQFFIDLGWSKHSLTASPDAAEYWDIPDGGVNIDVLQAPNQGCLAILIPSDKSVPRYRPLDAPIIQPGGVFDFNMRTTNAEFAVNYLQAHGWRMLVNPVPWQFGASSVKEMLAIQEDGIVLAAMERISPPLEGIAFDRFSDIFNATQMVNDMEASSLFFAALGFEKFVDFQGNMPGEGPRVLGLEHATPQEAEICLTISHPEKLMDGSIELISTPNQSIRALPERAFGRGIHRLRIPVDDLNAVCERTVSTYGSETIVKTPRLRTVLGRPELCCTLRTPDGARIDLYQE